MYVYVSMYAYIYIYIEMMYRYDISTYTCIYRQLVKIDKRKEDEQERQKDAPAGDATEHKGVQAEGEGGLPASPVKPKTAEEKEDEARGVPAQVYTCVCVCVCVACVCIYIYI